jgi:hypothetical protein
MDCNQVCQGIQQFLGNAVTNLFFGALYLGTAILVACALIWGAGINEYNSGGLGAAVEWAAFLTGAAAIANLVSGYPSNRQTKDPK